MTTAYDTVRLTTAQVVEPVAQHRHPDTDRHREETEQDHNRGPLRKDDTCGGSDGHAEPGAVAAKCHPAQLLTFDAVRAAVPKHDSHDSGQGPAQQRDGEDDGQDAWKLVQSSQTQRIVELPPRSRRERRCRSDPHGRSPGRSATAQIAAPLSATPSHSVRTVSGKSPIG